MVLATLLYRVSHLLVGVLAVAQRHREQPVQHAGIAAALGVSALAYGTALRRGWFDRRHIWADIVVCGCRRCHRGYFSAGLQQLLLLEVTLQTATASAATVGSRVWSFRMLMECLHGGLCACRAQGVDRWPTDRHAQVNVGHPGRTWAPAPRNPAVRHPGDGCVTAVRTVVPGWVR